MNKFLLERFIKKYYLSGINNTAAWVISNGMLQVREPSPDKKVFTNVTWKEFYGFERTQITILDTKRLLRFLGLLSPGEVSLDFVRDASDRVTALTGSDSKSEIQLVVSPLVMLDGIPRIVNVPAFNAAIVMDKSFKKWFFRAFSAQQFDYSPLTVLMCKETGKLQVAFGYKEKTDSDRSMFYPNTAGGMDAVNIRSDYSTKCLKAVLKANPEFKDPILHVSDAGVASVSFLEVDLDSQYYFIKLDVDD